MKRTCYFHLVALVAVILCASILQAQEQSPKLAVTPEKPRGLYEIGEPIAWSLKWEGEDPPSEASYVLKRGGLTEIGRGTVELTDGAGRLETKLDQPGAILAEFTVKSGDGKEHKAFGGAVVAPGDIKPAAEKPDDFDAFWAAKLAELAAVPPNEQLEEADGGKEGVEYWKITLDNIRGIHIHGQLARPANRDKLPALFIPQWAGVYPLEKPWVVGRAAEGWLVLNISAHDLPIDEPVSFYKEQFAGPLKDYWFQGNDDRDASYFLQMYLSCYRAIECLSERPDWDGRTLVVAGGSQGGQQSLVTAALNPKVTAALAIVPAGCDFLGGDVGRDAGWPKWCSGLAGKEKDNVRKASQYYDVVNFAPRVKCPVLVGFGLIDQTCPPEGVLAAVNRLAGPKEVVVCPLSAHQEINHSQKPYMDRCYGAWLPALRQGKPAPVKSTE